MARNELADITWKEIVWHRPFKLEQVLMTSEQFMLNGIVVLD